MECGYQEATKAKVGAGIPERLIKRSCIKTKAFQLTVFGSKESRSPSLLLQRLALSLSRSYRSLRKMYEKAVSHDFTSVTHGTILRQSNHESLMGAEMVSIWDDFTSVGND